MRSCVLAGCFTKGIFPRVAAVATVSQPIYTGRHHIHITTEKIRTANKGRSLRDVQEPILVFVLLVDGTHQRRRRWQDLVNEDEDGLFGRELDSFADDIDELADGEVGGDEVLLLIYRRDV